MHLEQCCFGDSLYFVILHDGQKFKLIMLNVMMGMWRVHVVFLATTECRNSLVSRADSNKLSLS